MKNKFVGIIVLFILTACNSNPSAEKLRSAKSENDLTKEELHQILLGRYQVIAGAWYVNKKCNFLSVKESENLEKHVGALNVYAQHNQLAPTEILLQMQKNAQFGVRRSFVTMVNIAMNLQTQNPILRIRNILQ